MVRVISQIYGHSKEKRSRNLLSTWISKTITRQVEGMVSSLPLGKHPVTNAAAEKGKSAQLCPYRELIIKKREERRQQQQQAVPWFRLCFSCSALSVSRTTAGYAISLLFFRLFIMEDYLHEWLTSTIKCYLIFFVVNIIIKGLNVRLKFICETIVITSKNLLLRGQPFYLAVKTSFFLLRYIMMMYMPGKTSLYCATQKV